MLSSLLLNHLQKHQLEEDDRATSSPTSKPGGLTRGWT